MIVQIVRKSNAAVVAEYPVNLGGQNYEPTQDELFEYAWNIANKDGLVEAGEREKYELVEKQS